MLSGLISPHPSFKLRRVRYIWASLFGALLLLGGRLHAATGGSIFGIVRDPSGAVIPGAELLLVNTRQQTEYRTQSDKLGSYSFPNLPVGEYDLTISAPGFSTRNETNLTVDADSAVKADATLVIGKKADTITVTSTTPSVQVETIATHLGEVVSSQQITALPLNGRSYTDLLAIQPGVAPVSTLLPSSVVMAGATGSLEPSGDLNPGNLSINGQRESSNGFLVDGIDVQEHMNGGTSIIPNLDSIDEFRVLTNNFDPEYGNYNGGIVTVVTKGGTTDWHGEAFEFFRNTVLDARGYFDPSRSSFKQNQFGGTMGGPIWRDKGFIFADYQGTRTTQGVSTGDITVPTLAQRSGDFSDLTGSVSGPYLASLLSQELGYTVSSGEPYSSVFPGGVIPQRAWSAPGKALLGYVPAPNVSASQFSTSAYSQTVRDDKGSIRVDGNTRAGQISAYYFIDDYRLDNPYPGSVAGASIPGFDALFTGRAQLVSLGDNKLVGAKSVNEFHFGYLRNANVIGQPKGGLGVSLSSQGFVTGPGTPGIDVQAPQFEGVENITFPTFVMGVPITNEVQTNNTFYVSDGFSQVFHKHTLKFGSQFHLDQVNEHPNATFNGTFNIDGTETGDPYADFLIGVASNFTQSSGTPFYPRNRYFGAYAQDSWRARDNLTINMGMRWDVIMPFWEKYGQTQTWVPGAQSTLFPGALPGLLVAGDPGVPKTLAPAQYDNLAPRIGIAWAPRFTHGILNAILGDRGASSIRASFGLFYTEFPGLLAGIMYSVPPFGYNYLSPAPPLMMTPFISAATGVDNGQRFPFSFPPHKISASHPDASINWANFAPLSAGPFFSIHNRAPYVDDIIFSVQRQIRQRAVLTVSYVGNQGHRIPAMISLNTGDPNLCVDLVGCGPFGEDNTYTTVGGETVYGTRIGQSGGPRVGPVENYGENTIDSTIANSSYNALEATVRYQGGGSQFLLSYAFSKSIDQASNIGEQLDPLNLRQSRAISAWDQKHSFVASYSVALAIERVVQRANRLTSQWSLSGTTRFASGFPVTLYDNSDNSLLGTLGNGVNNYLLDTPQQLPGPLEINTRYRSDKPEFNTALFPEESLGQLGNAKRRVFYGPGIENFDLTLQKGISFSEARRLELRMEAFNAFNHAQFYGPASVNGQVEDPNFGRIVSAASPRLMQVVARFTF
ncbi:TonB-dependent receptor [Acidobacteria bacterium AB60]|nr:TonB-dependent receptor [Acidobacteria bacterium AB60]